jgi:SSS family solute:Na+ symporter
MYSCLSTLVYQSRSLLHYKYRKTGNPVVLLADLHTCWPLSPGFLFFCLGPRLRQPRREERSDLFCLGYIATLRDQDGRAHPGLARAFSGVSNDALIVAGGANFPEAAPWKGGKKIWWNTTYVLEKRASGYQWEETDIRLPKPVAYGISLSLPQGLVCIGGNNDNGIVSDIFLLHWNRHERALQYRQLGDLPTGFDATGAAVIGDRIFVSGINGSENAFVSAPVARLVSSTIRWQTLPACAGPPRKFPVYAAQHNGTSTAFYLFGGRSEGSDSVTLLNDSYTFNVLGNKWHRITDILIEDGQTLTLMAAPALAYGASTIFIFGGDDGGLFAARQALEREMKNAGIQKRDSLKKLLDESFENHRDSAATSMHSTR